MREIKFRVFDKREKEMHEVVSIWGFPEIDHITVPEGDSVFTLFNNFQLMQFTGLKDKNGVEIYEGDVVEFYEEGGTESIMEVVEWDKSGYYKPFRDPYYVDDEQGAGFCDKRGFKVSGNIHNERYIRHN